MNDVPKIFDKVPLDIQREVAQKEMPNEELPFLRATTIRENCELAGFEPEAISYVQSVASQISTVPDLKYLLWYCHCLLCHSSSYPRGDVRNWEPLTNLLGELAGAFYLLVTLSGIPEAKKNHQIRRIPAKVLQDTYSDTWIWANDYKDKHNTWGIDLNIIPWLFNHLSGELYRLGRLQFVLRPFGQKIRVFRKREKREVMVLSEGNVKFSGDGQISGARSENNQENNWTSRLLFDSEGVIGTPIYPTGRAWVEETCLAWKSWRQALAPGDPVLEIHIPAGSPMDFDACGDSLLQALDFFPRYFPDRPFLGFCCTSWLLNTQYQNWLPPDSNIVRFQREFYLFPIHSNKRSGFNRIFGTNSQNFSKLPHDTRLRRAVLDCLESGGNLRSGGALLLAQDLDWGNQIYQKGLSNSEWSQSKE